MVRERDLKSALQPINWSARAVFRSIYLWASSLLSGCLASIKSSPENPISYKSGLKQPVTESCRHLCFSLHLLPHPRPDQTSFSPPSSFFVSTGLIVTDHCYRSTIVSLIVLTETEMSTIVVSKSWFIKHLCQQFLFWMCSVYKWVGCDLPVGLKLLFRAITVNLGEIHL